MTYEHRATRKSDSGSHIRLSRSVWGRPGQRVRRPKPAADIMYMAASVLDATILVAWGAHHLWLFFQRPIDPSLHGYLRDGLCLLALGICALICYSVAYYRERSLHTQMALAAGRMRARLLNIENSLSSVAPIRSRDARRKPGSDRTPHWRAQWPLAIPEATASAARNTFQRPLNQLLRGVALDGI